MNWLCSAGTHCSGKIMKVSHSLSTAPRQEFSQTLFPNTPYRYKLNQYSVMIETTNDWSRNNIWSREQKPG